MRELLDVLFVALTGSSTMAFAYVILSSALLFIAFGIASPLKRQIDKRLDKWKAESNSVKKFFYVGILSAAGGIIFLAAFIDIFLVNGIAASMVFQRDPGGEKSYFGTPMPWIETLTHRVQGYLYEWKDDPDEFTSYQKLYLKTVTKLANFVEKDHILVPDGIW